MSKKTIFLFSITLALLQGCYYDNEEDLLAEMNRENTVVAPGDCDTRELSYSGFIQPLLDATCTGCHRQGSATKGVQLDAYTFVQATAKSGQLVGVLKKENGYRLMPPSGSLDSCTIAQVEAWVRAGAPEN